MSHRSTPADPRDPTAQSVKAARPLGGLAMRVEASAVDQNLAKDFFQKYFGPHRVEAILPSGILQNYLVVLDYGKGTLTPANVVRNSMSITHDAMQRWRADAAPIFARDPERSASGPARTDQLHFARTPRSVARDARRR
jgi:hypothetical protein